MKLKDVIRSNPPINPCDFGVSDEYRERAENYARWCVQEEREACAKVCDDIDIEYAGEDVLATWCSAAIRARGNP